MRRRIQRRRSTLLGMALAAVAFGLAACAAPGDPGATAAVGQTPASRTTSPSDIVTVGIVIRPAAAREEQLTFGSGGTVGRVSVAQGDLVQKGAELVRLDKPTIAALARRSSQARVNLDDARETYEEPQHPFTETDIARAQLTAASARVTHRNAEEALADLVSEPTARDLADMEARVRDAEVSLGNAGSGLDQARITWDRLVDDTQDRFDDERKEYKEVFKRWLGVELTEEEVNLKPDTLLAIWGANLDVLFVQTPGSQAFNQYSEDLPPGGLPLDDLGTRWDETVIHIWANLYPGRILTECEDSPPITGEVCVKMEMEDTWDIYRTAREALETAKLQAVDAADVAENRVANAEKAVADAEDALEELKRGKHLDIAEARKQVDLTRVALGDTMEDLEETLEGPDDAETELWRARFVEAQQALEEALEDLDKAVLVAPFAGIVTRLNVEEGDAVGPNDVVLRLVDPTELEVQATVDEADLPRLRPGQEVRVILDALPNAPMRGTLAAISTTPVRQSGIVVRRVTVALEPNPQVDLREGMTAQVNFGTGG